MAQDVNQQAPVSEGDELDVTIQAMGEKGDGIARVEGFVLFVPDTKPGDEIRIRVTNVSKNVGFAERIGEKDSSEDDDSPEEGVHVDEDTGKEKIVGENFEAEFDPDKASEEF